MKKLKLTLVTVATDRYLEFWKKLYESALKFIDPEISVDWILFTNRVKDVSALKLNPRIHVKAIFQESLAWPFPTLLRYEIIEQNYREIKGEVVMHLDADMIFTSPLRLNHVSPVNLEPFITLIPHPGYYRPKGLKLIELYLRYPLVSLKDLKTLAQQGALGTWEKRRDSQAFVPKSDRQVYFCGGTWYGTKKEIFEMSKMLARRVREDMDNDVIAVFHDESHLNWYATKFEVVIGSVSLCFDPTYPQLKGIRPIIVAVNKNQFFEWKRE